MTWIKGYKRTAEEEAKRLKTWRANSNKKSAKGLPHTLTKFVLYTVVCKTCGKTFIAKAHSPACVPSNCPKCSIPRCCVCGSVLPKGGRKLCKDKTCRIEHYKQMQLLPSVIAGHTKQGAKMRGVNNPMANPVHRKKAASNASKKNTYLSNGIHVRSLVEKRVGQYLLDENISFEYEPKLLIDGKLFLPDFVVDNGTEKFIIEVCGWTWQNKRMTGYKTKIRTYLEKTDYRIVVVAPEYAIAHFRGLGKMERVNVIEENLSTLHRLELDNISNVDYSHFLLDYPGACRRIHSHSSARVGVKIWGYKQADTKSKQEMVVDFSLVKKVVKKAVKLIDHKMLIGASDSGKRTVRYREDSVTVSILSNAEVKRTFTLPKDEVVFLDTCSTVENLTQYLAGKVLEELPPNVVMVEFAMNEGMDNRCAYQVARDSGVHTLSHLGALLRYKHFGEV